MHSNGFHKEDEQTQAALKREYSVLSADALRTLLAARGVTADIDKLDRLELRKLARLTHFAAGDPLQLLIIVDGWRVRRGERGRLGPVMVDAGM